MMIKKDILYDTNNKLDVYLPENTKATLVFFHGGGLETGDKEDHADLFHNLTEKGIASVSANYRLYPDARYPDFIEDAAKAVHWTVEQLHPEKLFIGGSSAGAYLTLMLCLYEDYLRKYDINPDTIGFIADAAQPTTHFRILQEKYGFDGNRIVVDETAPLFHVKNRTVYPPLFLLVSDHDIPNRYEQTLLLHSALKQYGYPDVTLQVMNGYEHTGYNHVYDENGRFLYGELISRFILSHL